MNANYTVGDMKRISKEKGSNWFSEGSMEFFNTKIHTDCDSKGLFITSEYMDDPADKKYTVRQFHGNTGKVTTISDFREYPTLSAAKKARKHFRTLV